MAKVNKEGQVWQKVDKDFDRIKVGDFIMTMETGDDFTKGAVYFVHDKDDLDVFFYDDTQDEQGFEHSQFILGLFQVVELVEDVSTQEPPVFVEKTEFKVGEKIVAKVMWDGVTEGKVYDVSKVIGDQYYFINDDGMEMMFDLSTIRKGMVKTRVLLIETSGGI
jgi:hypothetical protein